MRLTAALLCLLALAACGRRDAPTPPGPGPAVIYPHPYPAQ